MDAQPTTLEEEFVNDHREMTRTIARLLEAVRAGDDAEAVRIAVELDRLAGPHIAFEEAVMYPEVARHRDRAFAERLYDEHRTALRGLRDLLGHQEHPLLSAEERKRITADIQTGLDHAVACGTLLSYLTVLDEGTKRLYLDRLTNLRGEQTRWSALHRE
jgi:hypothetical protein